MSKVQERSEKYQKINWSPVKNSQQHFYITLRKSKRLANLHKKRFSEKFEKEAEEICEITIPLQELLAPNQFLNSENLVLVMQTLKTYLISNEIGKVDEGLIAVKNLMNFSSECLKYLTDFNIFFYIIKLLSPATPLVLLERSAWIISDFLATENSKKIGDINLAVSLISCLNPEYPDLNHHIFWALGNLSADDDLQMMLVENTKIIPVLSQYIEMFGKTIGWVLSNLTKSPQRLSKDHVKSICLYTKKLFQLNDLETTAECLETLVNLSSSDDIESLQLLVDLDLLSQSVQSLSYENLEIRTPALHVIGNISAISHEHTQLILNLNILDIINTKSFFYSVLSSDMVWILSNIAAGTKSQVTKLMNHPVFESLLLGLVHYDMKTRTQSITAIKNLLKSEESSKEKILKPDFFSILNNALKETDSEFCRVLLEICQVIFSDCSYFKVLEETGCILSVESLSLHKNKAISEGAEDLIQTFNKLQKAEKL